MIVTHGVLSLLHPKLLVRRTTLTRSDKKGDAMDLDRNPNESLRDPEKVDVLKTGTDPTAVRQTIYSPH